MAQTAYSHGVKIAFTVLVFTIILLFASVSNVVFAEQPNPVDRSACGKNVIPTPAQCLPSESKEETPPTTSEPNVVTNEPGSLKNEPTCTDNKVPTVAERCRTSAGVYMGLDHDGNLIFSSDIGKFPSPKAPISVYSLVQKHMEAKKKNFEHGLFAGYRHGFDDGLAGKPSGPAEVYLGVGEGFGDGYKLGYSDGYAAGEFERKIQHLEEKPLLEDSSVEML